MRAGDLSPTTQNVTHTITVHCLHHPSNVNKRQPEGSRLLSRAPYRHSQDKMHDPKIQISRSYGLDWRSSAVLHGGSGKWVLTPLQPHFLCIAGCKVYSTNETGANAPLCKPYASTIVLRPNLEIHRESPISRAFSRREVLALGGRHWGRRPVKNHSMFEVQQ
jgi:hypothetical protein